LPTGSTTTLPRIEREDCSGTLMNPAHPQAKPSRRKDRQGEHG